MRSRILVTLAVTLVAAVAVGAGGAWAAPGRVDGSFDQDGFAEVRAGGFSTEVVRSLARQGDGKYLVAGDVDGRAFVARFDAAGSLDATFGTNGLWLSPEGVSSARWVSVLFSGAIVVGVNAGPSIVAYTLGTDGSLQQQAYIGGGSCPPIGACPVGVAAGAYDRIVDRLWIGGTLFAGGTPDFFVATLSASQGSVLRVDRYDFGYSETLEAMDAGAALGGNGIVMAGTGVRTGEAPVLIVARRASVDGTLDASFGTGGHVILPFSEANDSVASIVVAWPNYVIATRRGTLIRLTYDGQLDASFGNGGRVVGVLAGPSGGSVARVLNLNDGTGRLLVAGNAPDDGFALTRLLANGAVDASFANGGGTGSTYPRGQLVGAALQGDGGVAAAGMRDPSNNQYDIALARYLPGGALDGTFGEGGRVARDLGLRNGTRGQRVARQAGGRVVAGGTARVGADVGLVLVGFRDDGTPDPAFGTQGKSLLSVPGISGEVAAMRVMPDDRIVLGVPITTAPLLTRALAVVRFDAAGALDPTFASGGALVLPEPCTAASGQIYTEDCRVAIEPAAGGAVLVAAVSFADEPVRGNIVLYRLTAAGAVDNGFGVNGLVRFDAGGSELPVGLFAKEDGRVLLVAAAGGPGDVSRQVVLARFNANGTPDATFGSGGRVTTAVALASLRAARQADGSLILAGRDGAGRLALVRLSESGVVDANFGIAGTAVATIASGTHVVNEVMVGADRRYYAVGHVEVPGEPRVPYVARFLANGVLDKTFADAGISRYASRFSYGMGATLDAEGRVVATGWWGIPEVQVDDTMHVARLTGGTGPTNDFVGHGADALTMVDPATGLVLVGDLGSTKGVGVLAPDETVALVADLDGDARAEIVRQASSGVVQRMSFDANLAPTLAPIPSPGLGWRVTHAGDLDGDGKDDLAWRGPDDVMMLTLMDGAGVKASTMLPWPGWRLSALADLDGDGFADLVITHASGVVGVVFMRGLQGLSYATIFDAGSLWQVTLVADLDGDGRADIVATRPDGEIVAWQMNGATKGTAWPIAAAGGGEVAKNVVELVRGGRFVVTRRADGSWHLVGAGSFSGLRFPIFGAASPWSITHVRDIDGDGLGDLILRYTDGTVGAWLSTQRFTVLKGAGGELVVP